MSRYSRTIQQKASDLQSMKLRVFYLYGGETRCSGVTINEETSKIIIDHATEINPVKCNIKTIDSLNNKPTSSFASFKLKKVKKR
jgi:hypothetical protein